jgi:hypothetical protein
MRGRSLAPILALVILAIAIHATALSGFFLYDDPMILLESIRQPAREVLFDPSEYAHLSATSFTPLLPLSFKLDLLVHGLDPQIFYLHQLLAILIAAVLMFYVLRRYVPDLYATAGAAVFLTTWAAVYAARTLMIRHYVEGLVFALAALLAWRRSKVLAAIFYLLAMLSKEIYAPIPLLFICDSLYEWRATSSGRRAGLRATRYPLPALIARDLIAPVVAALIFLAWRWRMTGLTGTYSQSATPAPNLPALPRELWIHLTGPGAPAWVQVVWAIWIVVALTLFIWRYRLRAIAFAAVVLIVTLIPVLPVTGSFEWRYSFAFVALLVPTLILAASQARALVAVVLIATVFTSIQQRRDYEELTRRGIAVEGRYVWTQPPTAPTLAATAPAWYIDSLRALRKWNHRGDSPSAVFSPYAITLGVANPARMVAVDRGRIVAITATTIFGTPGDWQRARTRFDPAAPLSVQFALRNHDAQWRLGPPAARFVFLTDPEFSAIPLPAAGENRVPEPRERQYFRIVREEANGRWTASPTLPVPAEGAVTVWSR